MASDDGPVLLTAETWTRDERVVQTWVAEYQDHVGVGTTRADALRSLSDALDYHGVTAADADPSGLTPDDSTEYP
jgi:hypothetical protein